MFENGKGVIQSDCKATEWYLKAAEMGLAQAQYAIGMMYLKGKGVKQSDQMAVKWFKEAADQGHSQAQFNLGKMYLDGNGVKQSGKQAMIWFVCVAEQENTDAQFILGLMSVGARMLSSLIRSLSNTLQWRRIKGTHKPNVNSEKCIGPGRSYCNLIQRQLNGF